MIVSDLFSVAKGGAPSFEEYDEVVLDGLADQKSPVAYVSASTNVNGVNGYVIPKPKDRVWRGGLITVAAQGQGSVGFATVQAKDFVASNQVLVLTPRPKMPLNERDILLVAAAIRKNRWRFSFGRGVSVDRCGAISLRPVVHMMTLGSNNMSHSFV